MFMSFSILRHLFSIGSITRVPVNCQVVRLTSILFIHWRPLVHVNILYPLSFRDWFNYGMSICFLFLISFVADDDDDFVADDDG